MIRLLFIPFLVLFLFSCNNAPKEIDPLFYQMSSADSTECMNDILDEILEGGKENQRIEDELDYLSGTCFMMIRETANIKINSRGDLMVGLGDSNSVLNYVYNYFMFNRNLSSRETAVAATDPKYPGFSFPFYNRYSLEEIQRKIKETQNQADEIKSVDGADPVLVEYYVSKVDEWEQMQRSIDVIDGQTLSQTSPQARVTLEYLESTIKIKEVLKDIALAFYQMRNDECMRYFGETYLNLFDRQKRQKRKIDIEKVEALRYLHPSMIFVYNNENPRRVIPTPPIEKMN